MKKCVDCGKPVTRGTVCDACRVQRNRRRNKLRALEYKGGKCQVCGYCTAPDALVFHHLNPAKKDFQTAGGSTYSWAKIKEEISKCALLCQNCHAEVHGGFLILDGRTFSKNGKAKYRRVVGKKTVKQILKEGIPKPPRRKKKEMPILTCNFCGDEFITPYYNVAKYCTRECSWKGKTRENKPKS